MSKEEREKTPSLTITPGILAQFLADLEKTGLIHVNRRMLRLKHKS